MTGRAIELSPKACARTGGALYLTIIAAGILLLAPTLVNLAVLVPAFIAELSLACGSW